MLRVTVELVPLGNEHQRKILGTAIIGQIAVRQGTLRDYRAALSYLSMSDDETRDAYSIVNSHDRLEPVWTLVRKILEKAGY